MTRGRHARRPLQPNRDKVERLTTTTTDPVGSVLAGRYRVEAPLGHGAMGIVYRGTQLAVGRTVAIKLLPPDRHDDRARGRFEQEACALAALQHPHIVALVDYGVADDGLLYLVMEHLEGETLADLLEHEGPLPEGRAAHITRQLLAALGEAHGRNLVHRDLKPSNVVLTRCGRDPDFVKLIDFGIARPLGAGRLGLTATNDVIGSPRYLSPEQAQRRPLTAASDLYALGCVAYEMLTGAPPFADEDTAVGCILAHAQRQPGPPSRDGALITGALASWTMRCLAKAPWDRPTADVMLAGLDAGEVVAEPVASPAPALPTPLETGPTTEPRATRNLRRRRLGVTLGLFGVAAVVSVLATRTASVTGPISGAALDWETVAVAGPAVVVQRAPLPPPPTVTAAEPPNAPATPEGDTAEPSAVRDSIAERSDNTFTKQSTLRSVRLRDGRPAPTAADAPAARPRYDFLPTDL